MTATGAERRRVASVVGESSDVTRFRAFGLVSAVLALTVVALLALQGGPSALASPGPLALPHRELACSSCHADRATVSASRTCASCHGPHPSARPAHAALAAKGELACGGCHAVHSSESGLAFEPDGGVLHYGTGFETALGRATPGVSSPAPLAPRRALVPLVDRAACDRCHELARPTDPAWACFGGNGRARSGAFSVCFDEHRRPAERSAARAPERDAAVARAREIAPSLRHARASGAFAGGATLALGALAAGLVLRISRRRVKKDAVGRTPGLAPLAPGARRLPVIDASRCLGCNACVDACPYDVLEMSRYVAIVSRPDQCCGAGTCLSRCPNGSLVLLEGDAPADGPRLGARLESLERPGLFVAGDATGGSLIRGALEQGVRVARAVADDLKVSSRDQNVRGGELDPSVDLVVVGAGPAGLATGLEAMKHGLSVLVLEQASIAESVRRFSREKLVLDSAPADGAGLPLFLADAKKEELLRRWLRDVHASRLPVREGVRVVAAERLASGAFRVQAVGADGPELSFACRRVVLATGRRGSPRKLAPLIPEAAVERVHYELSDSRAFAGKRVVVVGLGDVAMETALALALQPATTVTMIHRGSGFSRGRQRNVEAIGRRVAEGRIGLLFDAEVTTIGVERLCVRASGAERMLAYDVLFVHVGSEPTEGLTSLLNAPRLPSGA